MKLNYFGLLFFIFSCGIKPEITRISNSQNVCKYSKWLRISETKDLVTIEIQNPDNLSEIIRLKLPNFNSSIQPSESYDLKTPIERLAVLSSTHIGMLGELDLTHRIVAVSNLKYVYNPELKRRKLIQLGDEQTISIEKIVKSRAELVVYSGFSNNFPKRDLLRKLKIGSIPNYDWREIHPLGRAEWILLFGYLTGHAEQAKNKFKEICLNYEKIQSSIETNEGPTLLSGNITGDFWYAPAGQSYHAKLFKDAGLSYVFSEEKGTGSIPLSFEKVLGITSDVDLWLNPGFQSKEQILQSHPKSRLLSPLNQSSVFCYSHNRNKYWEVSACRPDLILSDFAELKKGDEMNMYKIKIEKDQ